MVALVCGKAQRSLLGIERERALGSCALGLVGQSPSLPLGTLLDAYQDVWVTTHVTEIAG
jgi:hypothetical protein